MRRISWIIALAGSIALAADAQTESPQEANALQNVIEMFESPDRWEWQRPDFVLEWLGVGTGERVADIGTGTGYFVPGLSIAVGESGTVYAVDTSQTMLDYVRQRHDLLYENVVTILAEPDDPKLPSGAIDLVLLVNTWQYVDARVSYLEKLAAALDGYTGRAAVIDWREGEQRRGPISRLPRAAVVAEFEQAGWALSRESADLPYQYFLVFTPPAKGE